MQTQIWRVFLNNSFRNGLSDDNLDEISKQILRPENCDSLVKTCVNQGIWQMLKSFTQSEDSCLTAIQGVLLKASVNLIKLVEKLGFHLPHNSQMGPNREMMQPPLPESPQNEASASMDLVLKQRDNEKISKFLCC